MKLSKITIWKWTNYTELVACEFHTNIYCDERILRLVSFNYDDLMPITVDYQKVLHKWVNYTHIVVLNRHLPSNNYTDWNACTCSYSDHNQIQFDNNIKVIIIRADYIPYIRVIIEKKNVRHHWNSASAPTIEAENSFFCRFFFSTSFLLIY